MRPSRQDSRRTWPRTQAPCPCLVPACFSVLGLTPLPSSLLVHWHLHTRSTGSLPPPPGGRGASARAVPSRRLQPHICRGRGIIIQASAKTPPSEKPFLILTSQPSDWPSRDGLHCFHDRTGFPPGLRGVPAWPWGSVSPGPPASDTGRAGDKELFTGGCRGLGGRLGAALSPQTVPRLRARRHCALCTQPLPSQPGAGVWMRPAYLQHLSPPSAKVHSTSGSGQMPPL